MRDYLCKLFLRDLKLHELCVKGRINCVHGIQEERIGKLYKGRLTFGCKVSYLNVDFCLYSQKWETEGGLQGHVRFNSRGIGTK